MTMKKNLLLTGLLLTSLCLSAQTSYYVKPAGAGDGSSWSNAGDLNAVLAKELQKGDVIHLAAGNYVPVNTLTNGTEENDKTFEIKANISLIGGYSENPSVGENPDCEKNISVLNGNGFNHAIVVTALKNPSDESEKVSISGVHVTGGKATGTATVDIDTRKFNRQNGAGLITIGGKVFMDNVTFYFNEATNQGGAVWAYAGADVTIRNSQFESNTAKQGGGLCFYTADADLDKVEIVNNSASEAGGIYAYNNLCLKLTNSLIEGNNVVNGVGGLYARAKVAMEISNTKFINNESKGAAGGGLSMYDNVSALIYGSLFKDNKAKMSGSAFAVRNTSKAVVVNSTVSGGKGRDIIYADAASTLDLVSCTLADNVNDSYLIYNNKATVSAYNTIMVRNKLANGDNAPFLGETGKNHVIVNEAKYDETGAAIDGMIVDPLAVIQNLSDNGGNTLTYAVGSENPEHHKGMLLTDLKALAGALSIPEDIVVTDQRQVVRDGEFVTLGSFENKAVSDFLPEYGTDKVFTQGMILCIEPQAKSAIAVFSIAGNCVYKSICPETGCSVLLPARGVYLVKVNQTTYKVICK